MSSSKSGVPYAFYYADSADAAHNGYYYYVTNLQGDVIGILDADGNTVGSYSYNAWGAPISVTDSDESGLVNINPLRYRGYYYDSESDLYYLQSRYYDPAVGRFINADAYVSTGQGFVGCNMFAYCNNNSVNWHDLTGALPGQNAMRMCTDGGGCSINGNTPATEQLSELNQFINNTDEDAVYSAEHLAFYKGVPVVRHSSDYLTSWAYGGIIFLNHSYDDLSNRDDLLRHEYGHILQEKDLGTKKYTFQVFLPSTIYNAISRGNALSDYYYSMPWEYDASRRGNAKIAHEDWAEIVAEIYFWLWNKG